MIKMKTIQDYQEAYASGSNTTELIRQAWVEVQEDEDDSIFITKLSWREIEFQLEKINQLEASSRGSLYGVPFVVKDNIDLAGVQTTAGCSSYAYVPVESAPAVSLLLEEGAICLGKTNMDQFATGLVGTRSPYGVAKNIFNKDYLPGGSSSGSAVAVAKGLVPFSLGTDTAGSGRVPAAFNEIIGLKPSRGYVSTRGVVDACKSLDCVSVFANSCRDADEVLRVLAVKDSEEAWSRESPTVWPTFPKQFRIGVPKLSDLEFHGWGRAQDLYVEAIDSFKQLGGEIVEISIEPFLTAAQLLYEGPWVTERYIAIKDFLNSNANDVYPVTRKIIEAGRDPLASELFEAQYRLAECKRQADQIMDSIDLVVLPTTPRNFTLAEVEAEPVKLNSILGTYTNFMNLLDYSALALPAGRYEGRLPWGITIFAKAGMDRALLKLGSAYEQESDRYVESVCELGFDQVQVVVCGAHLDGMTLNHQLTSRGAELIAVTTTSANYEMYVIPPVGSIPERPAMMYSSTGKGDIIEVEVWSMTREAFGEFVALIPAPLGIGKIELIDGREVAGFIAEPRACEGATEITYLGGWRAYQEQKPK